MSQSPADLGIGRQAYDGTGGAAGASGRCDLTRVG